MTWSVSRCVARRNAIVRAICTSLPLPLRRLNNFSLSYTHILNNESTKRKIQLYNKYHARILFQIILCVLCVKWKSKEWILNSSLSVRVKTIIDKMEDKFCHACPWIPDDSPQFIARKCAVYPSEMHRHLLHTRYTRLIHLFKTWSIVKRTRFNIN